MRTNDGGSGRRSHSTPSGVGHRGASAGVHAGGGSTDPDVQGITGSNPNGGNSTSSGGNSVPSRNPGIDRYGHPRYPFNPHNPTSFPFIFDRAGSGNRSADSNQHWINNGYVGYSSESKEAAETAYRTQTINPAIRQWVKSNLPALRRAAGTTFRGDTGAWSWIVKKTPPGTSALDYIASLPNWSGSAPPDVPRSGGGSGGSGGFGGGSGGSGGGSGGGGGGGGGGAASFQTQINITDPITARNLINQTLSQSLGRMATDKEIADFTAALNAAERLNPQTGASTSSVDAAGNPVTSTITAGGLDRNQVVLDQINKTPEYQAFNTDNVFRQAMGVLASRGA